MLEFFITTYGNKLIGLALLALFGSLAYSVKGIARRYLNDKTKLSVAKTVVNFVEQAWQDIHGKDKLMQALEKAEVLLAKKGIPFDADEMMILIEAAVKEMNDVFQKTEKQQLPIKAGDYVGPQCAADVRGNT